jgi:hypothetical protein
VTTIWGLTTVKLSLKQESNNGKFSGTKVQFIATINLTPIQIVRRRVVVTPRDISAYVKSGSGVVPLVGLNQQRP